LKRNHVFESLGACKNEVSVFGLNYVRRDAEIFFSREHIEYIRMKIVFEKLEKVSVKPS
jgi:hypothetical protein